MHRGFGHKCSECYYARFYSRDLVCKINGKVHAEKKACSMYRDKPEYMLCTEEMYSISDIVTSPSKAVVGDVYFYANSPGAVIGRARNSASFPGYAAKLVAVNENAQKPYGFENVGGAVVWFRYIIGRKIGQSNFKSSKESVNA